MEVPRIQERTGPLPYSARQARQVRITTNVHGELTNPIQDYTSQLHSRVQVKIKISEVFRFSEKPRVYGASYWKATNYVNSATQVSVMRTKYYVLSYFLLCVP